MYVIGIIFCDMNAVCTASQEFYEEDKKYNVNITKNTHSNIPEINCKYFGFQMVPSIELMDNLETDYDEFMAPIAGVNHDYSNRLDLVETSPIINLNKMKEYKFCENTIQCDCVCNILKKPFELIGKGCVFVGSLLNTFTEAPIPPVSATCRNLYPSDSATLMILEIPL